MSTFHECSGTGKALSQQENGVTSAQPGQFDRLPEQQPKDISPPPNGGLQAWLQVLAGFSVYFNTWGLISAFGVFQTYYESGVLFRSSASNIAWIGALQASLTFFTGFITGPIFDRGYLRILLATGSVLVILGFMMVSICKTLYQLILAQGVCIGIGSGILISTVPPLVSQYFSHRLGLANGLVATGSAFGGIVYPIAFHNLLSPLGFGWSVRILGFIALSTLLPPLLFTRHRFEPARRRAFFDSSALTDPPFLFFMFGQMLSVIGLYSMLFFISSFALDRSITSTTLAFYLLPILNAGSLFGRVLPNILADKFGALNVAPVGAFTCALLILCMIAIKSTAGLIVMVVVFGFFSGIFIALPGVALVVLTKDRSKTGTRVGMGIGFSGFGALAGGPGGGSVLQGYGKGSDWTALWLYGGIAAAVAGFLFLGARVLHESQKRRFGGGADTES